MREIRAPVAEYSVLGTQYWVLRPARGLMVRRQCEQPFVSPAAQPTLPRTNPSPLLNHVC
jgi:hypothetical protein